MNHSLLVLTSSGKTVEIRGGWKIGASRQKTTNNIHTGMEGGLRCRVKVENRGGRFATSCVLNHLKLMPLGNRVQSLRESLAK